MNRVSISMTRTVKVPAVLAVIAFGALACGQPLTGATPTGTGAPLAGRIVVSDLSRLSLNLVSPTFSPDGLKILGGGPGGLEVGSADGSDLRVVEPDATSGVWSPGSHKVAVTIVHGGLTSGVPSADLVVMNADGSSRT